MARTVLGIDFVARTTGFVRGINAMTRSSGRMNMSVRQSQKRFRNLERQIKKAKLELKQFNLQQQRVRSRWNPGGGRFSGMGSSEWARRDRERIKRENKIKKLEGMPGEWAARADDLQRGMQAAGIAAAGSFIAGFVSAGVGAAITRELATAANAAGEFETELVKAGLVGGAIKSGHKDTKFLQKLRENALKVALKTTLSPQDTARAHRMAVQAGLDQEQANIALPTIAAFQMGTFGEIGMEEASRVIAVAFNKFKDPSKDAQTQLSGLADKLLKMTLISPLAAREFKGYLDSLDAAPALLNATSDSIFALSAVMSKAGMSSRRTANRILGVAPQFRQQIAAFWPKNPETGEMMMRSGAVKRKLAGLGLGGLGLTKKDFLDQKGELKNGIQLLITFAEKAYGKFGKKTITPKQEAALGKLQQQLVQALAILAEGARDSGKPIAEMFREYEKQIKNSTGLTKDMRDEFEKTWKGTLALITAAHEAIKTILGKSIADTLLPILTQIKDSLGKFALFLNKNKGITKAIVAFIALSSVGLILAGIFLMLLGVFMALAIVIAGVVGAIAMGGGPVILGFMGLLAASGLAASLAMSGLLGGIAGIVGYGQKLRNIAQIISDVVEALTVGTWDDGELWLPEDFYKKIAGSGHVANSLEIIEKIPRILKDINREWKVFKEDISPSWIGFKTVSKDLLSDFMKLGAVTSAMFPNLDLGKKAKGADSFGSQLAEVVKMFLVVGIVLVSVLSLLTKLLSMLVMVSIAMYHMMNFEPGKAHSAMSTVVDRMASVDKLLGWSKKDEEVDAYMRYRVAQGAAKAVGVGTAKTMGPLGMAGVALNPAVLAALVGYGVYKKEGGLGALEYFSPGATAGAKITKVQPGDGTPTAEPGIGSGEGGTTNNTQNVHVHAKLNAMIADESSLQQFINALIPRISEALSTKGRI